ncbi:MAG: lipoate protein ligase C-terminal domain-containing protein, partial [Lactobacillus sp.]|nr:lipoate protein ligase C-terminal domain-containing protein [Lactobacillus sp.]
LHVPKDKIESKGIKSVRARVTNVKPYLKPEFQNLTTQQFRDELIKRIWHVDSIEEAKQFEYQLTPKDEAAISELEKRYYDNWDCVYGKSPKFSVKKRQHFDGGTIDARFLVEDGRINDLKIYGDFFGTGDVKDVQDALKGQPYDQDAMQQVLAKLDLQRYFVGIDPKDVVDLLTKQH